MNVVLYSKKCGALSDSEELELELDCAGEGTGARGGGNGAGARAGSGMGARWKIGSGELGGMVSGLEFTWASATCDLLCMLTGTRVDVIQDRVF